MENQLKNKTSYLFRAFATFSLLALFVTSIWAWREVEAERLAHEGVVSKHQAGEIGDFAFTNSLGQTIGKKDLLGKPWIANFIFTSCSGPCPKLSTEMARLQQELTGADLRFVSFSVDPERDTPEVLASYAKRFQADTKRWHFLTGSKEGMHRFIHEGFRLAVAEAPADERLLGMEISHSARFVLIDAEGKIQGYFDGTDPVAVETLRKKAKKLGELGS